MPCPDSAQSKICTRIMYPQAMRDVHTRGVRHSLSKIYPRACTQRKIKKITYAQSIPCLSCNHWSDKTKILQWFVHTTRRSLRTVLQRPSDNILQTRDPETCKIDQARAIRNMTSCRYQSKGSWWMALSQSSGYSEWVKYPGHLSQI